MTTVATPVRARILDAGDVISSEIFTLSDEADHKGCFILSSESSKRRVRSHPSRILKINKDGQPVYRGEFGLFAKCKECNAEMEVQTGDDTIECQEHGSFELDWGKVEAGPRPAPIEAPKKITVSSKSGRAPKARIKTSGAKAPLLIDFEAMKKAGEIWTKHGVEFDYPDYELQSHVFIIDDGKHSRKFCFNSYNKTWGKKSKDEDIKLFITNKHKADGKAVGYYLKGSVDHERKALEKKGYAKEK